MRELICLLIPNITKAHCLGQTFDVCFIAGQKMPARIHLGTVVSFHVSVFLCDSKLRCLSRIKTDRDHFKLIADIESDLLERAQHSIQNLRA